MTNIDLGKTAIFYMIVVPYHSSVCILQEELKIKRQLFNYHDTRVHACLYFIAPTGHS